MRVDAIVCIKCRFGAQNVPAMQKMSISARMPVCPHWTSKRSAFVALLTSLILPLVLVISASFSAAKPGGHQTISRGRHLRRGLSVFPLRGVAPDWLTFVGAIRWCWLGFAGADRGFRSTFAVTSVVVGCWSCWLFRRRGCSGASC